MIIRGLILFINLLILYFGFLFAFYVRFYNDSSAGILRYKDFSLPLLWIILVNIVCIAAKGGYRERFKSYFDLLKVIFQGLALGIFVGMSFIFLTRTRWGSFPSSIFLISFPINFCLLAFTNLIISKLTGKICKKVLFIAEDELNNIGSLWNKKVDEMVIAVKVPKIDQVYTLLRIANLNGAKLSVLPKLYDDIVAKRVNGHDSIAYIPNAYFKNNPEESLVRICDVILAVIFLFFSLPLIGIVVLLIKIDSPGGVIYKQDRVGINGKKFMLYKFRSMAVGAAQYSRSERISLEGDDRVTNLGRLMRRCRIDEIPQIFNVLKGDMSLVGPRPEAVYRVREHRALQGIRLSLRPGLTGLAQIQGYYHTPPRNKLRYDYIYINNRSLSLNFNILLKTAAVILFRPGS